MVGRHAPDTKVTRHPESGPQWQLDTPTAGGVAQTKSVASAAPATLQEKATEGSQTMTPENGHQTKRPDRCPDRTHPGPARSPRGGAARWKGSAPDSRAAHDILTMVAAWFGAVTFGASRSERHVRGVVPCSRPQHTKPHGAPDRLAQTHLQPHGPRRPPSSGAKSTGPSRSGAHMRPSGSRRRQIGHSGSSSTVQRRRSAGWRCTGAEASSSRNPG